MFLCLGRQNFRSFRAVVHFSIGSLLTSKFVYFHIYLHVKLAVKMLFTYLMCMYCLLNEAMVECQGCFDVIRIWEQMDGVACYLYA